VKRLLVVLSVMLVVSWAGEILFVKWEGLLENVKWREAPEGRYGPRGFYVQGDFVKFNEVPECAEEFLLLTPQSFNKLYWYELV